MERDDGSGTVELDAFDDCSCKIIFIIIITCQFTFYTFRVHVHVITLFLYYSLTDFCPFCNLLQVLKSMQALQGRF